MSSIIDVAHEAKVAASTVSRVINGTAPISVRTQQRVQAAVRKLGYLPPSRNSRRKSQRAWHLGVVYSPWMVVNGMLVEVCRDWIIGIKQTASKAGGHLEIYPGCVNIAQDTMYRHSLDNHELHGVIIIGAMHEYGYVEDANTRNLPVVLMCDHSSRGGSSNVCADMYHAGKQAIEHLLSLGHTRIALGHLPAGMQRMTDLRRQGALDALAAHGLSPVIDKQVQVAFNDLDYFKRSASDLINAGVTGLFCSDYAAVRYIDALAQQGISVPGDISVVGCDHTGIKPASGQALTTISYDKVMMGRMAASSLMQLIRQRGEVQYIETCVPTRLVVNQTTAPARSSSAEATSSNPVQPG